MLLRTFFMFSIFHILLIFIICRSRSAPWWNGAPLMPWKGTISASCSAVTKNFILPYFVIWFWWFLYPHKLIYFSYISNHFHHLTAHLCSLVKWCTSDALKRYNISFMQCCNEKFHIALFCHLILVIFVSSQVNIFFLYFKSFSPFNSPPLLLGEMVHLWCLQKVQYRHMYFFGDFCFLTSWYIFFKPFSSFNNPPLLLGEMVHLWCLSFKPQTYSPAAELPQIAQSKLFKFQFGGNVKFENKINIKRTLFSWFWIHVGKLPSDYCSRICLKLFQIALTVF